ncbi:MAG: D-sedoheptulose 7-phosphate isomerase [Terracidiphilus sp.]|jgi:D-sedoheptulose 7-phosphate isomerase
MSSALNSASIFGDAITEHLEVVRQLNEQQNVLEAIALAMTATLWARGKILWCGNGGSAADSQHLAAELVGRFRRERCGLASMALTTDTSVLTSVANDCGFESVFSRQVEALGAPGDLLVGISTSGTSRNVLGALEAARSQGMVTVAFTGSGGGRIAMLADHLFAVPSRDTARIQEAHMLAGHMLCDWIELDWVHSQSAADELSESSQVGSAKCRQAHPQEPVATTILKPAGRFTSMRRTSQRGRHD